MCAGLVRAGHRWLTRLWEVVDTESPNHCARWPRAALLRWLRPRLRLEFSAAVRKRNPAPEPTQPIL